MLSNLSTSLRRLGRDKEAYEASRYALGLVEDRTTSHHVIWMALDELIASRPGDGVLRFSNLDKTALPARQQFLAKLLEAMRECDGQHPTEHKILVAAAKNSLLAARKSYPGYAKSPELKRAYWRTVKRMVRKIGGIRMHLWAISQK
jgi:hypothetical protein